MPFGGILACNYAEALMIKTASEIADTVLTKLALSNGPVQVLKPIKAPTAIKAPKPVKAPSVAKAPKTPSVTKPIQPVAPAAPAGIPKL